MNRKEAFTIEDCKTADGSFAIGEGERMIRELVRKRKTAWEEKRDLHLDRRICKDNADIILDTPTLREAVKKKPYLLIECCFSLVDKQKRDCPFLFNRVQADFISRLKKREKGRPFFILKGRQQGFTTLITAIQLSYSIVKRNFSGFTVADRDDNVKTIFLDKAKVMYSHLPKRLKPTEKFNSSNELYFDKLNSSWRIACASENIGRSRTLSFVHYSEAAFFKCSLSSLQKSVQETLVPDAICIYETTANGYGDAKELWDSGICENLFYGWWLSDEYKCSSPSERLPDSRLRERLNSLHKMGIPQESINWYERKYHGYIDPLAIRQEYPCSPEEAFISCGESIFNVDDISEQLRREIPHTLGYFSYERESLPVTDPYGRILYHRVTLKNIRFIKSDEGYIRIVEEPYFKREKGYTEYKPYVIGADTAGTGDDYFTAKVIDNTNGRCVATLRRQRMDEDLFSEQLYCLGIFYNEALLAVETNYSRHPVRVLKSLEYPNIYSANTDDYTGFLTTSVTRPLIIANLVSVMRDNIELETDRDTLLEMVDFVRHPSGKPQASQGKHDDLVMASAIARYVALGYDNTVICRQERVNPLARMFNVEGEENKNTYMEW
ncbi:MAG: hypothetical protein IJW19_00440 [Clostridia bacterium]|nr:hypothetical protein [Clostridia bacterium]